ncbi:MAG: PAS domain S-box protein [Prosthecobacter sp.]|uniref:PAS domain-containing sensor histidine kinase n=1 Tax=Prosthecobacter sp. TaxID=1965333 RepID=UPI003BB0B739
MNTPSESPAEVPASAHGLHQQRMPDSAPPQLHQIIALAGEALRTSEARYLTLFELGPMAIYCCDAAGRIQEYNLRATELWGRKPALGDTDQKFCGSFRRLHPDGTCIPFAQSPVADVLHGLLPAICDVEVLIDRPDGTQVTVIMNIRPQKNDSDQITSVINCFYDISERKQTLAALQLANTAMESAGNAIFITDHGGIIQYINPAFTLLTGYQSAEALGQKASLVRSDAHDQAFYQNLWQTVLSGHVWSGQITNRHKNGDLYVSDQTIAPVKDAKGDIIHFVSIQEDITARKHAEEVQHRAEVLAASNQKLELEILHRKTVEDALRTSQATSDELLETSRQMQQQLRHLSHQALQAQEDERKRISRELHDVIAQTLTGINMRLSLLQKENCTSTQELREKIAQTQQLVAESVDTVHRFARDLRPAMLDDLGLIPALESYLKDFTQQTGLEVNLKTDAGVEELGSSGRTVLYRVAQEALTNVVRHARATRVDISIQKHDGIHSMVITDNGQGFAGDDASPAKGSSRLGLLGMRERVEIIGGTFCVASVPGQHTTVLVEIPADSNELMKNPSLLHAPHHYPAG